MEKSYLRPFGETGDISYPLGEIRYRSDDGRTLEVVNPFEKLSAGKIADLKSLFDKRAGSWEPVDRSGVWRYREFLPAFKPFDAVVTKVLSA